MMRIVALVLAAVLASVPLAGRAEDPFEINVIVPLTGNFAFLGKEEAESLSVLESTVNKAGGIRGRQVKFVVADDGSNAQTAVQLTNNLIAKKVPVFLGTSAVANCSAMAPLLANGPVGYCFSPGIHPPDGSYVFSASISTVDYIIASIRYMKARGWKKIALLTSTDATGQDADKAITAAINAPENGGTISLVDQEHFNTSDVSVAAQMAHIKSSGAQVAILWTVGTAFGTVLRGAVQGGLTIPLCTSAGNLNFAQLISYASFMPDNLYIMAAPWAGVNQLPNGALKRTIVSYNAAFKAAGIRADQGHSLSWDPGMMVVDAYKTLGFNASAAQIRGYFANLRNWVGVNGVYDFHQIPQRGIGIDGLIMVRWDPAKQDLIGVSKLGGAPPLPGAN
jgi:branched-chain amino acid transport system substrate-binding protein